jgi:hypothetical protein
MATASGYFGVSAVDSFGASVAGGTLASGAGS